MENKAGAVEVVHGNHLVVMMMMRIHPHNQTAKHERLESSSAKQTKKDEPKQSRDLPLVLSVPTLLARNPIQLEEMEVVEEARGGVGGGG